MNISSWKSCYSHSALILETKIWTNNLNLTLYFVRTYWLSRNLNMLINLLYEWHVRQKYRKILLAVINIEWHIMIKRLLLFAIKKVVISYTCIIIKDLFSVYFGLINARRMMMMIMMKAGMHWWNKTQRQRQRERARARVEYCMGGMLLYQLFSWNSCGMNIS
jgi:hypothetical protein